MHSRNCRPANIDIEGKSSTFQLFESVFILMIMSVVSVITARRGPLPLAGMGSPANEDEIRHGEHFRVRTAARPQNFISASKGWLGKTQKRTRDRTKGKGDRKRKGQTKNAQTHRRASMQAIKKGRQKGRERHKSKRKQYKETDIQTGGGGGRSKDKDKDRARDTQRQRQTQGHRDTKTDRKAD